MNFINKIRDSIYSPSFYQEIINQTLGSALKYFFKLVFVVSLLSSIVLSFIAIPNITKLINESKVKAVEEYPVGLEIKLEKGVVSTNVEEPYFVKVVDSVKEDINNSNQTKDVENFVVINTKKDFSSEDLAGYKTLVLITKDSFVYESNGQITVQSLRAVPNVTVNKENIINWIQKYGTTVDYIKYSVPFVIFAGLFISHSFLLVYFFFVALLIFVITKIAKMSLTYKDSYKITVYASTLSIILSLVARFLSLNTFNFMFTLVILGVAIINLKNKQESNLVV